MGERIVPFDANEICDICGNQGAYDFMGDLLCPKCANNVIERDEPCNRCGGNPCECGE